MGRVLDWAIRLAPVALCVWAALIAEDHATRLVALAVLLLGAARARPE